MERRLIAHPGEIGADGVQTVGQAVEALPPWEQEKTIAYFERIAKGKSASLLSLM